jgi:tetratricopeptide (TPR) repeat protein
MRKLLLIIGCLLTALMAKAEKDVQHYIDSAKYYYEKNRFSEAIRCYENILSRQFQSPLLHYNLANAYYKNNRLGKAIYHYELGRKLDPGNEDIRNNLSIVSSKVVDKIEVKENFFAGKLKTGFFSALNTAAWAWLSLLFFAVTLIGIYLYTSRNSTLLKKISFWVSGTTLIFFIVCLFSGYTALQLKNNNDKAVILSPVIQVFPTPNAQGNAKFSLHEGTRVRVLEHSELWTSIQLDNGNEGWVKNQELGFY